jgi:hypothetical protein
VLTQDEVTQFCIEEAAFLRLDMLEKKSLPDFDESILTADSGQALSPGEQQAADHAARMLELRGQ